MGHADIRTTLNVYAKTLPGWEQAAAVKVDSYLDAQSKARAVLALQLGPVSSGPQRPPAD
jgi:hypothetical protein